MELREQLIALFLEFCQFSLKVDRHLHELTAFFSSVETGLTFSTHMHLRLFSMVSYYHFMGLDINVLTEEGLSLSRCDIILCLLQGTVC